MCYLMLEGRYFIELLRFICLNPVFRYQIQQVIRHKAGLFDILLAQLVQTFLNQSIYTASMV